MVRTVALCALLAGLALAQPYEHVVVTADSMVGAFAPLGDYIENRMGLNDTVVAVDDICASFPGRDDAEKLRNFIRYAYQSWGTTHVLLAGDDDAVPVRYAWGRVWWAGITMMIPSDWYYACLDGDWDADGDDVFGEASDSVDLLPDVFVGRAPVSPVALFVQKTLSYSSDSTAPYLRNLLLAAFDIDDSTYGETTAELYDSLYVPEALKPCSKVYDSHTGNHRDDMLAKLNEGQHIVVHWDHSNWNVYGCGWRNHGWTLSRNQLSGLTNGDRLSIIISSGCSTGQFDTLDCIVEHALGAPNGGAVAAIGNTRYGLYGRDAGQNPQRTLTSLQTERVLATMLAPGRTSSLESFTTAKASLAPLADTREPDRWCMYTYTLFGEPCMPVWVPAGGGVEETDNGEVKGQRGGATIVRGVLFLPGAPSRKLQAASLLDACGRKVMELLPGANDVRHLAPGVYLVRSTSRVNRSAPSVTKLVVQR